MSECNHTHTSSCSPAGIYLYVTCMDCGAILNESPEGARLRNECPKFEAEQFSRGSCKHCHHSAQYHYDALAAENAALRKSVGTDVGDYDYPPGSAPCMCFFSTAEVRGPDPLGECDYHRRLRAQLADLQGERDVAELSRDAAHARLAECESQLRAVALKP